MNRKCFGQVGRLKPEKIAEYKKLHREVWPDVLAMIKECNMENYSIFLRKDLVFAYFEYSGTDFASDMKHMEADPVTQNWWKLTKPCFDKMDESSKVAFYEDMENIFYFA